jgi:hypothetical protein
VVVLAFREEASGLGICKCSLVVGGMWMTMDDEVVVYVISVSAFCFYQRRENQGYAYR